MAEPHGDALPESQTPGKETMTYSMDSGAVDLTRPKGWKYKQLRLGPLNLNWYAHPKFQLVLVAFVCFMCPGMFNALGGLGGGGKTSTQLADNMNTALYSTFAIFAFLGGAFVNKFGVKACLAFGGTGYCLYAISLLVSVHASVGGFNIFAGAFLGVCAGLLWTAQGTIMMSYPGENEKGHSFAWFWAIFNMGAVIGGLIPLGLNINVKVAKTVSDSTYIAFIVLMFFGACLALLLCNADDIIRSDGSRVILRKNPTVRTELMGLWTTLKYAPYCIALFPMFFASNWFYTWQQNGINAAKFNVRTRALNDVLYWAAQMVCAVILGPILDWTRFRRSTRARAIIVGLFALTMIVWGGGYAYEKLYTRSSLDTTNNPDYPGVDWTDGGKQFIGPMFLYFFYGFYDAVWQGCVYWFIGALTNSGRKTANLVGFYKGIQSAGAAIMWSMDSHKVSYKSEFISNWVLLSASLLIAAPVVFIYIKDHTDIEQDLQGTNETAADVLPQGHVEKHDQDRHVPNQPYGEVGAV